MKRHYKDKQPNELLARIAEQDARIAELEKALKFSLENGMDESFYDGGCGCCSTRVDVPPDIMATLKSCL